MGVISGIRRGLLAGAAVLALGAGVAQAQQRVIRTVPSADVTVLDPMFSTAWISLIHGVMIYESLFTLDSQLNPKPQMAESWSQGADGLSWRITLREGQAFHDGAPVTAADVVASIQRWLAIDTVGRHMAAAVASVGEVDGRTIEIKLSRPYPGFMLSMAAIPARFQAVMRAQDAVGADGKPVLTQVSNAIGSGPFRFNHAERVSGHKSVYERNAAYRPRAEPPDGLAGGRHVKVDRVEWRVIPDPATASAALQANEVDMLERGAPDLLPLLRRNPNIRLMKNTHLSGQNMLRPNASIAPFNKVEMRRALNWVVNQSDYMAAAWGEPENWRTCNSFFICGTPFGTEAGAEHLKMDLAKARQMFIDAGYKGEKLYFISTKEIATLGQMAEVAADALKKAGLNIEIVWNDWGTVGQRLRNKDSWHMFLTGAPGAITFHPLTNVGTDMTCEGRNFVGWPCDLEVEKLRSAFLAADDASRPKALETYHRALVEAVPYRVLGQYDQFVAARTSLSGLLESPVVVYWNIEKK
jgi:peptide/nickel transport system substrate-binding protein